ncbi:MAG: hydroxychlorobactene glucosyltransferase CruC [Ktedonobacterales bacterium]
MPGRRVGSVALWGFTAMVVGFYAVLARRTVRAGAPVCAPSDARAAHDPGDEVLVSIIVPARDEERNIRTCVESLLEQEYPHFEVLVVDDGSRDATPDILAQIQRSHPQRERLRVARVDELPAGWAGKPHALHVGASLARGSWLLFTDADTRHTPAALGAALACARARQIDLFSLGTRQDLPDFWGRVLMPVAYTGIGMLYPTSQVNDPASDVAIANGQYILIRRAVYNVLGGYGNPRLRGTVLDDRDLAREVKRAGYRIELADGRDLVQTRMYHGLGEHWQGWSKNAYAGSRGGPAFFALMTVGLPVISILPFALALGGLAGRRWQWTAAGATQVTAILVYRTDVNRGLGVPGRYAWTHPLGAAVFTGILARSAWRKLTGQGVQWRNRTYQI